MQTTITGSGTLTDEQRSRAEKHLEKLEEIAQGPVLAARMRVAHTENPSVEDPVHAEGEVDLNGRIVRAHVSGPTPELAIDGLADRLERQLRRIAEERVTRRRRNGESEEGAWRHGQMPTKRLPSFPRPAGEREVIRRKTFAAEPMTPLQATADMLDLDHDFFLFRDMATGCDAVVHRLRDDERIGLIEPAGAEPDPDERWLVVETNRFSDPVPLRTALDEMDSVEHRFLFFVDADTDRGSVLYRRYDGHYGLIEQHAGES